MTMKLVIALSACLSPKQIQLEHQQWACQMPNVNYIWHTDFFGIVLQYHLICEIVLQRYAKKIQCILIHSSPFLSCYSTRLLLSHPLSLSLAIVKLLSSLLSLSRRITKPLSPSSLFLSESQSRCHQALSFKTCHRSCLGRFVWSSSWGVWVMASHAWRLVWRGRF